MNYDTENLPVMAEISTDLKEMFEKSAGWRRVRDIIEDMRREAFSQWGDLKLGAPVEDVISLRAQEKILKELLNRIEEAVKKGDEARMSISMSEADSREELRFRSEKITTDREIEGLRSPLQRTILQRLGLATTP